MPLRPIGRIQRTPDMTDRGPGGAQWWRNIKYATARSLMSSKIRRRIKNFRRCSRIFACSATSEMQTGDLGCEDVNERSTEFLVRGCLFTLSGFGAHAKHRYHPG